jgi:IclR family transcriptional regulator, pca regulon regulatory protein
VIPTAATPDTSVIPSARNEAMGGLAKGLAVIRAFADVRGGLTLTAVALATGLAPATARRCLLTLEELGYVTRDGRNFLLRPKVLELGAAYLDSMSIEQLTGTYLEDLAQRTGDSASLTVLDGFDIVYIARASVRTLLRLEAHIGSRLPAYPTSMGRVLLSGLSAQSLDDYLTNVVLTPLTEQTVVDHARLGELIAETRRLGYAAVEDELAYGVVAVAVPVCDSQGRIVAALNCSGHSKRMTKAKMVRERLPLLREVSKQLSRELAHLPGLARSTRF